MYSFNKNRKEIKKECKITPLKKLNHRKKHKKYINDIYSRYLQTRPMSIQWRSCLSAFMANSID